MSGIMWTNKELKVHWPSGEWKPTFSFWRGNQPTEEEEEHCLFREFFKDPANRGKPAMISCPCRRCRPQMGCSAAP